LFIGACGGGAFGLVLSWMEPHAAPSAYALLAMGAVLAAVIQAPLMSILLLFELTRNYDVMTPIMLTAVTATVISRLIFEETLYTQPLQARGVRVGSAAGISMLQRVTIDQLKLEPLRTIQAGQLVGDLLKDQQTVPAADYVVLDDKGKYLGTL